MKEFWAKLKEGGVGNLGARNGIRGKHFFTQGRARSAEEKKKYGCHMASGHAVFDQWSRGKEGKEVLKEKGSPMLRHVLGKSHLRGGFQKNKSKGGCVQRKEGRKISHAAWPAIGQQKKRVFLPLARACSHNKHYQQGKKDKPRERKGVLGKKKHYRTGEHGESNRRGFQGRGGRGQDVRSPFQQQRRKKVKNGEKKQLQGKSLRVKAYGVSVMPGRKEIRIAITR